MSITFPKRPQDAAAALAQIGLLVGFPSRDNKRTDNFMPDLTLPERERTSFVVRRRFAEWILPLPVYVCETLVKRDWLARDGEKERDWVRAREKIRWICGSGVCHLSRALKIDMCLSAANSGKSINPPTLRNSISPFLVSPHQKRIRLQLRPLLLFHFSIFSVWSGCLFQIFFTFKFRPPTPQLIPILRRIIGPGAASAF